MMNNQEPMDGEIGKDNEERVRKRLDALLPDKNDLPTHISIQQVEKLNARIHELEAQLTSQTGEIPSEPKMVHASKARPAHPVTTGSPASIALLSEMPKPAQKGVVDFLVNLFSPPVFDDPAENRLAKTQNAILLSLITVILLLTILTPLNGAKTYLILVPALMGLGVLYYLLKRRYVKSVSWGIIGLIAIGNIAAILNFGFEILAPLSNVILIILVSALIQDTRWVRGLTLITQTVFIASVIIYAPADAIFIIPMVVIIIALVNNSTFALNNTFTEINKNIETISKANADLQYLADALEERTSDIHLASEVGRIISEKVGDIYEMLAEAVETIGNRFGLYYTQVYLLDPSERTIVLRAGTGEVGRQLLNRGHRLLANSNSLNGRAVIEKRPIIVSNTKKDETFLPNPLLPHTRSEMAIPLVIGSRVIGTLDMQSTKADALNENNLPAFEALAGLLAVAIQNSQLFAESVASRKQMETAIRSLTEVGWQDFMNGIDHKDKIGYVFAQSQVTPLEVVEKKDSPNELNIPISVEGKVIGEFQAVDDGRTWTAEEKGILHAASEELARHLESLRLLAQSRQYRQQAEDVARRLTREGWQAFIEGQKGLGQGFVYDKNQIIPLKEEAGMYPENGLSEPITVREETIGELAVDIQGQPSEDAKELIATIASQLSDHIENLRLLEQAEQRRTEAESLLHELDSQKFALDQHSIVGITDQTGKIVYANDKFVEVSKYSREELLGQDHRILNSSYHSKEFIRNMWVTIANGKVWHGEIRNKAKDGTLYWVDSTIVPFLDQDGKPTRYVAIRTDITERKKAEIALQEGEARLRTLVENAPEAILVVDLPTGLFREPNENAVKLYGLSRDELVKVGPAEMSPLTQPDGRPSNEKAMENINEAMAGGSPVFEWMHRNSQGQDILCEVRLVRLPGDRPQVRASVTDITERKKAEDALRASEARYSAVLTQASDGAVLIQNNVIQYLNAALADMLGYSIAEMENQPMIKFIAPESRQLVINRVEARIAGKEVPSVYEAKLQRKDGTVVETEISAGVIEYSGQPADFAFIRDIAERKKAQEAIARRASELATVATVSTTTSTVLDPDELLQSVVDLTKERFGLYHAHIYIANEKTSNLVLASGAGDVGRTMASAGHSILMNAEVSLVARSARERKAIIVNDVRSEPGFLPNPMLPETRSEMAVPMIVGDAVLGVFDVQSDTVHHFTEQDANIYTTLASQVAVALQNARLFTEVNETAERLREVDKMKSEFLANMSHELRTPLNSVIGYSEILLTGIDGELDDEKQADVQAIFDNAKHLLTLINDVLDLAKIEAGRLVLKKEIVNIGELIENVKNNNYGLIHVLKKPVELVTEIGIDIPSTFVDPVRISQVLNNLVSNAVKFSEKGTVMIRANHENDWLRIEVEDQGIGIDQEDLSKIFERFSQVDGSTTRRVEGTGLGLPITYHLVEMHGGSLNVESEVGKGSKFTVLLPVSKELVAA